MTRQSYELATKVHRSIAKILEPMGWSVQVVKADDYVAVMRLNFVTAEHMHQRHFGTLVEIPLYRTDSPVHREDYPRRLATEIVLGLIEALAAELKPLRLELPQPAPCTFRFTLHNKQEQDDVQPDHVVKPETPPAS